MNQMLLWNVSVLHYPDSLTARRSPEILSPDFTADVAQTCWRYKTLAVRVAHGHKENTKAL